MKTVILAGGFGTRFAEETEDKPKPMVRIGDRPIIWHIMSVYASWGYKDFIIACGYKGEIIRDYFQNILPQSDNPPDWRIDCVDTGLKAMTGGRLLRLKDKLSDSRFMVTYGDGVGDIDLNSLLEFHKNHRRLATVTAVRPPARFGCLELDNDHVTSFAEKSPASAGWINGGFFVFEPEVLSFIEDDQTKLEAAPLVKLAEQGELMAFKHRGYWKPMDTLREKRELEADWQNKNAPWVSRNK
ncbi:MAG: glucose-1-phosphate cytidylyltransferase [Rhodospirillaceae bacterium]|nr:glucose-1-phosphate cytidylyltransferase [Rhodospirillaceae bacterium]